MKDFSLNGCNGLAMVQPADESDVAGILEEALAELRSVNQHFDALNETQALIFLASRC